MPNSSLIYYILVYGQVILQLLMYLAIIYLIVWPLRQVLNVLTIYFKVKSEGLNVSSERSSTENASTSNHMD